MVCPCEFPAKTIYYFQLSFLHTAGDYYNRILLSESNLLICAINVYSKILSVSACL